jgi:hypothetical protein
MLQRGHNSKHHANYDAIWSMSGRLSSEAATFRNIISDRIGGRPAYVGYIHQLRVTPFFPLSGGTIYSRSVLPYHQPDRKPPFSIRFVQLYMISSYFLPRYFIFSCHVQSNLDQPCRQNYWFLHISNVCNFFGFLVQSKSTPADLWFSMAIELFCSLTAYHYHAILLYCS